MEVEGDVYAFWGYDLFPYCVGGKVSKMREDGKVYVPDYQSWMQPIALRSGKTGAKILADLNTLRCNHTAAVDALLEEYKADALGIAPFLAKEKSYSR